MTQLAGFPKSVTLVLSERCNLRCRHCRYGEPREVPPASMDAEGFAAVVRDLASVSPDFVVQLSGGEPLLFPGLESLVEAISGTGARNLVNTNGMLLSKERIRSLSDAGLQEVVFSLDGFRVIHDYIRRKRGAFKRVMEAVEDLRALAPQVKITILPVISAYNLDQIAAFARWLCDDERISAVVFQFVSQPMPADADAHWYLSSDLWPEDPGEAARVLDALIALREETGSKVLNPASQLALMKRYFADPNHCVQGACTVGFRYLTIDGMGHVRSCVAKPPLARLQGVSILEVLASPEARQYLQAMRACRENCHYLINCAYEEGGEQEGKEAVRS